MRRIIFCQEPMFLAQGCLALSDDETVLYVAIMGAPRGIPLFDSVALLGRDEALARLRSARGKLA